MKIFFIILFTFLFTSTTYAKQFTVVVLPPTEFHKMIGQPQWDVFVSGEIDKSSPEKFRKAVNGLEKYGVEIHLDSPGGNLVAGIELGRLIRKFGFNTSINKQTSDVYTFEKSECFSACAMTFLGGSFRYISEGSLYGVHRFYNDSKTSKNDLDTGQILNTLITNYIIEMGVNPSLLNLIIQADKNQMYILSSKELQSLNVVNFGRFKPEWSIEIGEKIQYLKGSQYTNYGLGKLIFYCNPDKSIELLSVYEIGNKTDTLNGSFHSLMLDDKTFKIQPVKPIKNINGYINTEIHLSNSLSKSISLSKSVGHAIQADYEAPTFRGYRIDIPDTKRDLIRNFINNCID